MPGRYGKCTLTVQKHANIKKFQSDKAKKPKTPGQSGSRLQKTRIADNVNKASLSWSSNPPKKTLATTDMFNC